MSGAPSGGAPSGKWGDLVPRILSAVVMVVIAATAVWLGGHWMHALISICAGLMVWELARMLDPACGSKAVWLGTLGGAALLFVSYTGIGSLILPMLLAPGLVGFSQLSKGKAIFTYYTGGVLIAGFGLISLRDLFGIEWTLWLLIVVIMTDVAGYFAGRILGGPKFWPKVSPKKTWSGTVAGWIGAALVGYGFMLYLGTDATVIWISVLLSFASQMGDAAESAIKRHTGVKDSSALIPGHGGVLDRFDAMLGASVALVILQFFVTFPVMVG